MELTKEEKDALIRFLQRNRNQGNGIGGAISTNAVYIKPAQLLRNRADEMEKDERDAPLIESVLTKLSTPSQD